MFSPLPKLGQRARRPLAPQFRYAPLGVRLYRRRTPDYQAVKEKVLKIVGGMRKIDRDQLPPGTILGSAVGQGTLPEIVFAIACIWARIPFQYQQSELGGRVRLGGGVVDFIITIGARPTIVRIQGQYFHSLPGAAGKDAVQWARLHQQGYLVVDIWEAEIYMAFLEDRLVPFVLEKLRDAA